ncbi:hypothetical protein GJAV_G00048250 [Gymnothorax javanicus]|nr:hypothetical protein GJAV_G00048250 [Gymnothorax javanicus]
MDTDKRRFNSNGSLRSSAPSISPILGTSSSSLWHSTPVKKRDHVRATAELSSPPSRLSARDGTSRSLQGPPEHSATCRSQPQKVTAVTPNRVLTASSAVSTTTARRTLKVSESVTGGADVSTVTAGTAAPSVNGAVSAVTAGGTESAVLQKQRRELQLLMAELKDRDQELNAMVAAHHKQLQAWEQDRQRVLTLEQRGARLEAELQKRKELIQALTQQLRIAETQQRDEHALLCSTRQQLQQLSQQHLQSASQCQELQERSESLDATILELSSQVGLLKAHEEELSAMLSLKDKDVLKATDLILELSGRFQKLEGALKEQRSREARVLKEVQVLNSRCHEARVENGQLREELGEKREEIIRLKQENERLQRELAASGEDESRKDELLRLARSKQDRTESELHCLRQVCENQQNDLQLLQLNLESAKEALMQRGDQALPGSQGDMGSLPLHCPAFSPSRGRSSVDLNGPSPSRASPSIVANGDQGSQPRSPDSILDGRLSPTTCLQRLLAKSQEMVASLELGSAYTAPDQLANSSSCGSTPSQSRQENFPVTTSSSQANLLSHSAQIFTNDAEELTLMSTLKPAVLKHWDTGGSHFVEGANKTV